MTKETKENPNPVTEVRKITPAALVIERTHEKPVTSIKSHDINDLKAKIANYQGVIAVWQAKIDPLQAIIDEYDEIYAKENPTK
jgi:hypothetical protein